MAQDRKGFPVDRNEAFGRRVRKARNRLDLSQADVASDDRLGVRTATVNAWEKGKSEISRANLVALAEVLREDPDWLLDGVRRPEAPATFARIRENVQELAELVGLISPQAEGDLDDAISAAEKGHSAARDADEQDPGERAS